jgi:echinoderm microtubule-associated protein-like 1/2
MESDGIDGLLQQENGELRDRVADLEKKVLHHTDEIACLKSAMADTLRRLHTLESSRGKQQPILTSKPSNKPVKAGPLNSSVHDATQPTEAGDLNKTAASTNTVSPSPRGSGAPSSHHSGGSTTSLRRSQPGMTPTSTNRPNSTTMSHQEARRSVRDLPSATNNTNQSQSASGNKSSKPAQRTRPAQGGAGSVKEAVYMKDESQLRIYLRGRAINMPIPTNFRQDYDVAAIQEAPEEKLKLEWVYGYRGRDCRNNVHYLPTGEVVYYIASVVVLYNVQEQTQRHYFGHNDDVKSIAIHPDKITIATGQVAGRDKNYGKPHVRVWNSVNLNTLHILGLGDFERAVSSLAFSKADGGNQLCVIDDSNDHVISLWDWQTEHKVTETKSSTDPVIAVEFHPLDENSIVTCGKNHLAFWTLDKGQLSKKMAIYEKYEKPKFVLSMTFAENGDLITGDSSGNIHIWKRGSNKVSHCITAAHDGSIFALCVTREGHLVSGGGKDKRILVWVLHSIELVKRRPSTINTVQYELYLKDLVEYFLLAQLEIIFSKAMSVLVLVKLSVVATQKNCGFWPLDPVVNYSSSQVVKIVM